LYRRALLVGRFQPLHWGHIHCFKYVLERASELVIGIGSSQYSNTERNPLSTAERYEMIVRTLRREGFPMERISIVPIPDTERPEENWGMIVLERIPRIDIAFSNDPETMKDLSEVGIRVEGIPFHKRKLYEATKIRKKILQGDNSWRALVPEEVAKFLDEIKFEERLKSIIS
jgi:nicotinamide-nucleotide adenylyltransferase